MTTCMWHCSYNWTPTSEQRTPSSNVINLLWVRTPGVDSVWENDEHCCENYVGTSSCDTGSDQSGTSCTVVSKTSQINIFIPATCSGTCSTGSAEEAGRSISTKERRLSKATSLNGLLRRMMESNDKNSYSLTRPASIYIAREVKLFVSWADDAMETSHYVWRFQMCVALCFIYLEIEEWLAKDSWNSWNTCPLLLPQIVASCLTTLPHVDDLHLQPQQIVKLIPPYSPMLSIVENAISTSAL